MNLQAFRLTNDDRKRIRAAMLSTFERWDPNGPRNETNERLTLERVGWHSIGCSEADLRQVELDWIARLAADVVRTDGHPYVIDRDDVWPPNYR